VSERRPGPFDDIFGGGGQPPPSEPTPPPPPREEESFVGGKLPDEPRATEPPPPEPLAEEPAPPPQPLREPQYTPTAPYGRPSELSYTATRPLGPPPTAVKPPRRFDPIPYIIGGVVFLLALLVFALFLPPFELLADDDDDSPEVIADVCQGVTQTIEEEIPTIPTGLEALSPLRLLEANEEPCGPLNIGLNLTTQTDDGSNLGFYTYVDNTYRKEADAELTADGTVAQGQLEVLPENIIVLRRVASSVRVEGFLPAGQTVDADGQGVLQTVTVEAYAPVADGTLSGGPPDPVSGVEVIPVVRADTEDEDAAVDNLLQSDVALQAHVEARAAQVQENSLPGIEIDYGCIDPSLRDRFTNFVLSLSSAIGIDRRLSIVVPAPEGPEGSPCLNFGAYDLRGLADVADFIKLMPIRNQPTYRQSMSQVLSTAVAEVPRQKLILVVSAYGTVLSPDGARQLIAPANALAIAATPVLNTGSNPTPAGQELIFIGRRIDQESGASGIAWSDDDLSVTFSYEEDGTFQYWVENAFSIAFKLDLAARFQLAGVAVDDASGAPGLANVWAPLRDLIENGLPTLVKPNPDSFTPEWRVDGQPVEGANGTVFNWTAVSSAGGGCVATIEAGQHCITLVVSDGEVRAGSEVLIAVTEAAGTPTPTPTATP
jgi:hypothetical protein